jgi:hypothetical protein
MLLVLFTTTIKAQEFKANTSKKTYFGITGGVKQDFFTSSPYSFNGLNLYGGFFVERKLSEKFSLQLEILHTKTQGSGFNTVEFPLFLKYKLSERLSVYAGVQLNASYRDNYSDPMYSQRPGNFAFTIGIQYDLSERWYLFARYIHNVKRQTNLDQPAFMRTFLVGAGYRF